MTIYKKSIMLLVSLGLLAFNAVAAAPAAGDMAPDELGKLLNGDKVKLADYSGKVVVVSFWASWCGYCLKEMPILEGIQRVGKANLQVIAVNRESRDQFSEIERRLRSLTMKLSYDPGDAGAKAYGVNGIPHLVIIGRDGKIIAVHRGYGESSLPEILDAINLAIATPAPT